MIISVFIGVAAVFFIIGILFIVKGVSSEEQEAVPISNPKEIEELKSTFVPSGLKTVLTEDPIVPQGEVSPDLAPPVKIVQPQESREQIQIDQLTEKNQQLIEQLNEQKDKFEKVELNIEVLKKEYKGLKEQGAGKIKILEEQMEKVQSENGRLTEGLSSKSELLEKKHEENQRLQTEMRATVGRLELEKEELLKVKDVSVDKSDYEALSNRLVGTISTVEGLKGEYKDLQKSNDELKDTFKRTEELNVHLLEKERLMQYELIKNRAQALGLEKICEDFKAQIEAMTAMEEQTI